MISLFREIDTDAKWLGADCATADSTTVSLSERAQSQFVWRTAVEFEPGQLVLPPTKLEG